MDRLQLRLCCRRPRLSQSLGALPALVGEAAQVSVAQLSLRAVDQGLLPPTTQQTWCGSSRLGYGKIKVPAKRAKLLWLAPLGVTDHYAMLHSL